MPRNALKSEEINPLEALSALLQDDMRETNAQILRHMQSPVDLIPKLAAYLIAAGGKRIRPLLTLASAKIYGGAMNRAHGLAAAVEFIHSATLLHDDVVDESEQRRGQDAANLVFGNQASVLVGDFLFARAFQLMVADGSLDVLKSLSDAAATIAQGEVLQLAAANEVGTSMDHYIEIVGAKTAALFAAACEVGPLVAGEDGRAMAEYGYNLGVAFQIADDALDYEGAREKIGKTVGDDFREGKMTAPVIEAFAHGDAAEKDFWRRTMGERDQKEGDLKRAQEILARHDAIERSLLRADSYAAKAVAALEGVPADEMRDILGALAYYSVRRDH